MKRWIASMTLCGLLGGAVALAGQGGRPMQTIMDSNAKVEKLAGDLKFTEGPIWVPDKSASGGHLLFSDIPADTIYKWTPGSSKLTVFRNPCGNTNGHTLDMEGRLLSCEHSGRRVSRTEKDGKVVSLASHYNGKKLNSPNDIVVKSNGDIYFTDPPYGIQEKDQELNFSGVYRIGKDGKLTLLVDDFPRPNGLTFSPDEKRLYINDSQVNHIRVFDVKPDGTLENGRIFADLTTPGKSGVADGMKVDTQGNVYTTGPEGVWVISPEGKVIGKILTPEVSANCGWGDKDYKTLYMTSSTSLYRIRLKIPGIPPGKPIKK